MRKKLMRSHSALCLMVCIYAGCKRVLQQTSTPTPLPGFTVEEAAENSEAPMSLQLLSLATKRQEYSPEQV